MDKIYNLIHIYLSPWFKNTSKSYSFSRKYIQPFFNSIKWIGSNFIYIFLFRKTIISKPDITGKSWLMVSSLNNRDSLSFINEGIADSVYVSTGTWSKHNPLENVARLSFHPVLIYVLKLPFVYFKHVLRHGMHGVKTLDKVTEANGMIEACKRILKQGNPRCLIFANDHNIKMRGLLLAAKELKIPTVYVQHASVSESFPPLDFDLAILEGEDSKSKYLSIGDSNAKIELAGMSKFDSYLDDIKSTKRISNVGICTNLLSDLELTAELISNLQARFPELKIAYRAHPRDDRRLKEVDGILISNSREQTIFDFLKNLDLLIAGETSTHLEAALLNIPSVQFAKLSTENFVDYYGYIKNNLITQVKTQEELNNWIVNQSDVIDNPRTRTNYYNATVGTEWDGKSKELTLNLINAYLGKEGEKNTRV